MALLRVTSMGLIYKPLCILAVKLLTLPHPGTGVFMHKIIDGRKSLFWGLTD
jgi:hypothetical protein